MLQSKLEKQPSKADMERKVKAWETINSVLVKSNAEFMSKLRNILTEKTVQHEQLKTKLENGTATGDDNAEYLFLGGYVQCLKDILNVKN